ncbi:DMT family transporter [Rheinheimera sp. 4Y26]|uniref:DMT family transporter n=1 Tax=Rheinheimera sp. 4Y26 TaxID=2977811 RepID=UPI0021B12FDB|nr:DMT family transporter [Rheinheimera sp. 4Y26]MCT6699328.1 DMT family transporter [Rheinheimera sp. 4Y26]
MHQASGKSLTGFILALTTAVLWGMLPIALKVVLTELSANTITWVRFLVAAIFVVLVLWKQQNLPKLGKLKGKARTLMLIAVAGLLSNYILYLMGLNLLTAETAQVVIQLAPFLMMLGGIFIFRERLLLWQKIGAATLVAGLLLFFNDRLLLLVTELGQDSFGILLVIIAAFTWAAYALAQKQLLMHFNSQQIMAFIYVAGALCFLPVIDIAPVFELSLLHWALLLFCCLNTIVAYGAFAEALEHWEASKVSAVLAITPLLTILFANLAAWLWPEAPKPEALNLLAVLGAVLVVFGSAVTALAPVLKQWRQDRAAA